MRSECCQRLFLRLTLKDSETAQYNHGSYDRVFWTLRLAIDRKKNFYHGLLLGLLRRKQSELADQIGQESGDGFSDIIIKPGGS